MADEKKMREYQNERLTRNCGTFKKVDRREAEIFELQLKIKQLEQEMMRENNKNADGDK